MVQNRAILGKIMAKILIIEDEKILSEMYYDKFSQAGYEVFLAFDAQEGLSLAKKKKPDLVILDVLLPRENGISFLAKLRSEPKISSIPVIAFSNYDVPETRKEAEALGVKDYLIKTSYTPQEMVEKVKNYLQP